MLRPFILSLIMIGAVAAADDATVTPATEPATPAASDTTAPATKAYPLDTDLVSGDKLGASAVSCVFKGQEFKFANAGNMDKFEADPKTYVDKLAVAVKAVAKKQTAPAGR
jgi:YHS domain-containing protein